jgi:hypothetical protein
MFRAVTWQHVCEAGVGEVTNHSLTSPTHHMQGPDGKWNKFGGRLAWDSSAICSNNPAYGGRGNPKQGDDYAAAPNVDHSQVCVCVLLDGLHAGYAYAALMLVYARPRAVRGSADRREY